MKKILVMSIIGLLVLSGVYMAYAATSDAVQASVTVPGSLSISITDTTLAFGDMAEGQTKSPIPDPLAITVDANKAWTVKGSAPAGFTPAGLASSNLKWDTSIGGTFVNVYAVVPGTQVATGGYGSGQVTNLYHKLTIPAGTLADSYTLDITYSIA